MLEAHILDNTPQLPRDRTKRDYELFPICRSHSYGLLNDLCPSTGS